MRAFCRTKGAAWLLGVGDGIEALAHPLQRLVQYLQLLTASFVGWLGCAAGTFCLHSSRTLAPQQAEVLLAGSSEPILQVLERRLIHARQSVGVGLVDERVFLGGSGSHDGCSQLIHTVLRSRRCRESSDAMPGASSCGDRIACIDGT